MHKWECIVNNGFGDKNNVYAWAIKEYKDYIYIGTLNSRGCQIYRSKTGNSGTWKKVSIDGFSKNKKLTGIRNLIVYKNLLWAVAGSWDHGAQVWVTNGEKTDNNKLCWKKASEKGFGKGRNIPTIRSVCVYKDKLYIGTRSKDIPRIYRYNGPKDFENIDYKKWDCINEDWKQNPGHNPYLKLAGQMIVFKPQYKKEYLYVGVYIDAIPLIYQFFEKPSFKNLLNIFRLALLRCEIWRYDCKKWEKVSKNGFGKSNSMALCSQVLDGALYYGTHNFFGAEIWKTSDGVNWEQVVRRGFRIPFNFGFWGMQIYDNKIVIGTMNSFFGTQIWSSMSNNPRSNNDFTRISQYGINGSLISNLIRLRKQDGVQELEPFKDFLYAGTASWLSYAIKKDNSGCEVWRISQI